jgi:hypothetical protein
VDRAAVEQTRDSTHHEIKTSHDLNTCGNLTSQERPVQIIEDRQ